jgi:hypothetical protein
MDQQHVHQAAGIDPAASPADQAAQGPQASERPAAATDWQGYSLDTLDAILDGEAFPVADW